MQANHTKIYEHTLYPQIYKRCNFMKNRFRIDDHQALLENRNHFIEEFHITSYKFKIPFYVTWKSGYICDAQFGNLSIDWSVYDHAEFYKTADNKWVIVVSPYHLQEESRQKLITRGWRPYAQLYSGNSSTFVFIMDARRR